MIKEAQIAIVSNNVHKIAPDQLCLRVIFAHGASYAMSSPPRIELLLDPVVLKFATLCTLLFMLFSRSPGGLGNEFWVDASLWAFALVFGITMVGLVFSAIRFLMRRGAISFVYTPLIFLPLAVSNEVLGQAILTGLRGSDLPQVNDLAANVMQNVCALVLFDILFGTFVAPSHPLFARETAASDIGAVAVQAEVYSVSQPALRENAIPLQAWETDAAVSKGPKLDRGQTSVTQGELEVSAAEKMTIHAVPEQPQGQDEIAKVLHLNGDAVPQADVLCVRAQDHYVRVYTQPNVYVQRANFTEFLEEFPEEVGVQVSRSAWVSFEHVSLVWRTNTMRYRVVLINGEEIQVATSRNIRVADAMRQRGIPVIQSRNSPDVKADDHPRMWAV